MSAIKRMIAVLVAASMVLALSACGQKKTPAGSQSGASSANSGISQPQGPVVQTNLLTGMALSQGMTAGQRPVAIMVNNARAALPQRGVGSADAVFEMVTEGGITRLMALYSNAAVIPQVGPVRSARDQHLQFALPLNAIFVHIGSSIYAANLLNQYAYQDIDGMYLGTTSFLFDTERSKTRLNEHCWYTDASLIAAGITKQQIALNGANTPLFTFRDASAAPAAPSEGEAPDVAFQFSADGAVRLTYDAASGTYLKQAYSQPQIDELTGAQLAFNNVMLLFTDITLKPDGQCTEFALSRGKGYYCYGGKYQEISWSKGGADQALKIADKNGKALAVNVGKSYIAVVGNDQAASLTFNAAAAAASSTASVPAASAAS